MVSEVQNPKHNATAAVTGLALAWCGTALLISPVARSLADPSRPLLLVTGILLYWALAASVIASVLFWEKQPLGSLWLQAFRWQSIGWGIALAVLNYAVLFPAGEWLRHLTGLSGFSAGMEEIMRFPIWYRMLAVAGAGIVEELLFRGFTVTRLAALTGRVWLAALLALVGFSVLHAPFWGWGFAVGGFFSGAAAMAFFAWRRDLLAMMVFHTITDAIGLVIAPEFSNWWHNPSLH